MALNIEVRHRWIAALRSDKYKQARGRLRTSDGGYCCLGVLCHLAINENIINEDAVKWNANYPPEAVATWLGVPPAFSTLAGDDLAPSDHLFARAASWNDYERLTFAEIADDLEGET